MRRNNRSSGVRLMVVLFGLTAAFACSSTSKSDVEDARADANLEVSANADSSNETTNPLPDSSSELNLNDVGSVDFKETTVPLDIKDVLADETSANPDAKVLDEAEQPDEVDEVDIPQCEANCDGKVCGNDGCGGSCGSCSDGDFCTDDTCVVDGCVHLAITYCCLDDDDCVPPEYLATKNCYQFPCNLETYQCELVPILDCCETDDDCDDGNFCTKESCVGQECVRTFVGHPAFDCCETADDCNDGNYCTNDYCSNFHCSHVGMGGCDDCFEPVNCDDENECTFDVCLYGMCKHIAGGGTFCGDYPGCEWPDTCCLEHSECDDQDPCTDDFCSQKPETIYHCLHLDNGTCR